jgi:hypothetical protein
LIPDALATDAEALIPDVLAVARALVDVAEM